MQVILAESAGFCYGVKRAVEKVYEQIGKIVAEGKTAIVISSDMTELIGLCDRVYVMNEGRMVGELSGEQITQENIMRCIISNAVRGEAE